MRSHKWSKEIHTKRVSILLTNYLHLGLSIKKGNPHSLFHINLWTCQIEFRGTNEGGGRDEI